jgi:hypothetical protein
MHDEQPKGNHNSKIQITLLMKPDGGVEFFD